MSKESTLIKDFRSKDVQRMRNIITKNYNNKTGTQIGYNKEYIEHGEGDVWEERGKKWTIINGIKQTVTRLDELKEKIFIPLVCEKCNNPMNNKLDKYMYPIHQMCFNCVIEFETKLKYEGKFEDYILNIKKQGIIYHIKEMENILLELLLEQPGESFVTEAGDIELWKGKLNNQQYVEDIQEYINKLKSTINL